jgi:hypothetical protein
MDAWDSDKGISVDSIRSDGICIAPGLTTIFRTRGASSGVVALGVVDSKKLNGIRGLLSTKD